MEQTGAVGVYFPLVVVFPVIKIEQGIEFLPGLLSITTANAAVPFFHTEKTFQPREAFIKIGAFI